MNKYTSYTFLINYYVILSLSLSLSLYIYIYIYIYIYSSNNLSSNNLIGTTKILSARAVEYAVFLQKGKTFQRVPWICH